MKTLPLLFLLIFSALNNDISIGPSHFYGAWKAETTINGITATHIKIVTPKHFVVGIYNSKNHHFVKAYGGTWKLTNEGVEELFEFDSDEPENVGAKVLFKFNDQHEAEKGKLVLTNEKQALTWQQIDEGNSSLFGTWRITERKRNGTMNSMPQGDRKTWKVLSGNRFQWAAFNVATKQFLGTGGGTFTTENGKYKESIDFFSRDNARVGMELVFDFEIKGKNWHHSGLSSKGSPIYEIWTNQD